MVHDTPLMILVADHVPMHARAQIRAVSPRVTLVTPADLADDPTLWSRVEVAYGMLPIEDLHRMPRLRWAQLTSAGADGVLTPAVQAHPVVVTNIHIHAEPIAEHLFGMLLMLTRHLDQAYQHQGRRHWGDIARPAMLDGMTLGIVGTGAIGRRAAQVGTAFGMRVVGMRRHEESLPGFAAIYTPTEKATMLAQCDVLMLALPLTPETDYFLDAEALTWTKPGVYLLNVGRGKLIDTEALLTALRDGRVAGVGLDVTDPEPLPADHPLWTAPNTIITPHYAGLHPRYMARATEVFVGNLQAYLAEAPLVHVVNKTLGY